MEGLPWVPESSPSMKIVAWQEWCFAGKISLRRVAGRLVAVALHAVEIAALDADEARWARAQRRVQRRLVVDYRHAGLQRVVLHRLDHAGPLAIGRAPLAPPGHLGGAARLSVDPPGSGAVRRLPALPVRVDVRRDSQPQPRPPNER